MTEILDFLNIDCEDMEIAIVDSDYETVLFDLNDPTGANNPHGLRTLIPDGTFNLDAPSADVGYFTDTTRPGGFPVSKHKGLKNSTWRNVIAGPEGSDIDDVLDALEQLANFLDRSGLIRFRLKGVSKYRFIRYVDSPTPALLRAQPQGLKFIQENLADPDGLPMTVVRHPYLELDEVSSDDNLITNALVWRDRNRDGVPKDWTGIGGIGSQLISENPEAAEWSKDSGTADTGYEQDVTDPDATTVAWQEIGVGSAYGILSNKAYFTSDPSGAVKYLLLDGEDADGVLEGLLTTSASQSRFGLVFRHSGESSTSTNDHLRVTLRRTGASGTSNRIALTKRVAGAETEIAGLSSAGLAVSTSYQVRIEPDGESVKVYLDDVLKIDYTLSAAEMEIFGEKTFVGLAIVTEDDGGSRWDDFLWTPTDGQVIADNFNRADSTTDPGSATKGGFSSQTMTFAADLRLASGGGGGDGVRVIMEALDSGDNVLATGQSAAYSSSAFDRRSVTMEMPALTITARVRMVIDGDEADGAVAQARHAKLEVGDEPGPFTTETRVVTNDPFAGSFEVQDRYDRTVADGWGTATGGAFTWAIDNGPAADFDVAANKGSIANPSAGVDHRATLPVNLQDQEVRVRFDGASQGAIGVIARRTTADTFYRAVITFGNPAQIRLEKMVAGTTTVLLANTSLGFALNSSSQVGMAILRAVRNKLEVWVWVEDDNTGGTDNETGHRGGLADADVLDAEITAAGGAGVSSTSSAGTPTHLFDDFEVVDLDNIAAEGNAKLAIVNPGYVECPVRIEVTPNAADVVAELWLHQVSNEGIAGRHSVVETLNGKSYVSAVDSGLVRSNTGSAINRDAGTDAIEDATLTMNVTTSQLPHLRVAVPVAHYAGRRIKVLARVKMATNADDVVALQMLYGFGDRPVSESADVVWPPFDRFSDFPTLIELGEIDVPEDPATDELRLELWAWLDAQFHEEAEDTDVPIDALLFRPAGHLSTQRLVAARERVRSMLGSQLIWTTGTKTLRGESALLNVQNEEVSTGPSGGLRLGAIYSEFRFSIGIFGAADSSPGTPIEVSVWKDGIKLHSRTVIKPERASNHHIEEVIGFLPVATSKYEGRVKYTPASPNGDGLVHKIEVWSQAVGAEMLSDPHEDKRLAYYLDANGQVSSRLDVEGIQPLTIPPGTTVVDVALLDQKSASGGLNRHVLTRTATFRHKMRVRVGV